MVLRMKNSKILGIVIIISIFLTIIPFQICPLLYQRANNSESIDPQGSSPPELVQIPDESNFRISAKNGANSSLEYIDFHPDSIDVGNGTSWLLQDSEFNMSSNWTWTSTSNVSSTRLSPENVTEFKHQSAPSSSATANATYQASSSGLTGFGEVVSGTYVDTHDKDGTPFHLQEELHVPQSIYKFGTYFDFSGLGGSSGTIELNCYLYNSPGEQFHIDFWDGGNFILQTTFNCTSYSWVNLTVDNSYIISNDYIRVQFRDEDRATDPSIQDQLYLDYLEVRNASFVYTPKQFTQSASVNQTFGHPHSGTGTYNLTFDYQISNFTNIESSILSVKIWNESHYLGQAWQLNIIGMTGWITVGQDISTFFTDSDIYNISVELNVTLNTILEANITVLVDNVQIESLPATDDLKDVDNNYIQIHEEQDWLDLNINSTIPLRESVIGLNFSIFSRTSNESYALSIYNFTSSTWLEYIDLNDTVWTWKNFSITASARDMVSSNNLTMIKITDKGYIDGSNDFLQIDYLEIRRFSLPTNITILESSATTVIVGTDVSIVVYLNDTEGNPMTGATITTNYTEDSYFVIEQSSGNYSVVFYTATASQGERWVNVVGEKLYYGSSSTSFNFSVGGFSTDLSITQGAVNANGTWEANPQPYVNDTTKIIQVYFNGTIGLRTAQIFARPDWINGTYFNFIDLSITQGPLYNGYYDITLDTTGLHAGEEHSIYITASKDGYNPSNITLQIIVQRINTTISTEGFENLTRYEGETVSIGVNYIDIPHSDLIVIRSPDQGNVTWELEQDPTINGTMELFLWSYKADLNLPALGVQPGNYNITIRANATDYLNATAKIELNVLPKTPTNLSIIDLGGGVYLLGKSFDFIINLTLMNGTPIRAVQIRFNISWNDGAFSQQEIRITNGSGISIIQLNPISSFNNVSIKANYLGNATFNSSSIEKYIDFVIIQSVLTVDPIPKEILFTEGITISARLTLLNMTPISGAFIQVNISYDGITRIERYPLLTDGNGRIIFNIIPPQGATGIIINIAHEELGYSSYVNQPRIEIDILTIPDIFLRFWWIWVPPIIGAVLGPAIYQWGYKAPRKRRKMAKWKVTYQKFLDADNIEYLLVSLSAHGIPVHEAAFKTQEINAVLLGGFLGAISAFKSEFKKKEASKTNFWAIDYQDFIIYTIELEHMDFTFILSNTPSESLKMSMERFANVTEEKHFELAKKFDGEVRVFNPIGLEARKFFEIDIVGANRARELRGEEIEALTKFQIGIFNTTFRLTMDFGFFKAFSLIDSFTAASGTPKEKIGQVLYGMFKKGCFEKVEAEDLRKIQEIKQLTLDKTPLAKKTHDKSPEEMNKRSIKRIEENKGK